MSDNGEVEVENPSGYQVLPKEVTEEIGSIKLFNKWSYEDVEIRDISLTYVHKTQHQRQWKGARLHDRASLRGCQDCVMCIGREG